MLLPPPCDSQSTVQPCSRRARRLRLRMQYMMAAAATATIPTSTDDVMMPVVAAVGFGLGLGLWLQPDGIAAADEVISGAVGVDEVIGAGAAEDVEDVPEMEGLLEPTRLSRCISRRVRHERGALGLTRR